MILDEVKDKILEYYDDGGKHSNYQNFPVFLTKELGIKATINEQWRGDTARFLFIEENIVFKDSYDVIDVGANTGRFCLDLAYQHPNTKFYAYELNKNYTKFINFIGDAFKMNNIEALNISAGLNEINQIPKCDIMLHMNVIHHAGVDFDKEIISSIQHYIEYVTEYLKRLSSKCNRLVFQMGYNWGGNKKTPIVEVSNIIKMIELQVDIFKSSGWRVSTMGLYDNLECKYVSRQINKDGLENTVKQLKMDMNSEFYKRPLFILDRNI